MVMRAVDEFAAEHGTQAELIVLPLATVTIGEPGQRV